MACGTTLANRPEPTRTPSPTEVERERQLSAKQQRRRGPPLGPHARLVRVQLPLLRSFNRSSEQVDCAGRGQDEQSRKLKVWNARIMAVDRAASPDYAAIDRRIASSFNITTDTRSVSGFRASWNGGRCRRFLSPCSDRQEAVMRHCAVKGRRKSGAVIYPAQGGSFKSCSFYHRHGTWTDRSDGRTSQ